MEMTQPRKPIERTGEEVARYKSDVDAWQGEHDALATDCWTWEDLIDTANHLFARILRQDERVQRYLLVERGENGTNLQDQLQRILREWKSASSFVVAQGERLEREFGRVEGLDALRENLSQANSILTPDDEFFAAGALTALGDEAIDTHRRGLTEPLIES